MSYPRHQYPASLTTLTSVLEICQRILKALNPITRFNKVLLTKSGMIVRIAI